MTTPRIGHNGGPDIDGRKVTIRTAWAKALFADPETPPYVMAIAWAIHWYSKSDGTGAALSNPQLQTICGISEDTATRGKNWLRKAGYVHLKVGNGVQKTQFQMVIPPAKKAEDTPRPERTQSPLTAGPLTAGPLAADPHPLTADPGVRQERVCILERDSGRQQEKSRAGRSNSFWKQALNPEADAGVSFEGGKLALINGAKAKWVDEFGGDEKRLDLALVEISPYLQPNSPNPLIAQVESKLARIAADKRDRDTRYANAAKAKSAPTAKFKPSRW